MTESVSRRSFLAGLGAVVSPQIQTRNPVGQIAYDLEIEGWAIETVAPDGHPEIVAESDGFEGALMERFAVNFAPYGRYDVVEESVTLLVLDGGTPRYLATADPSREWPANRNRATLWMLDRRDAKASDSPSSTTEVHESKEDKR